MQKKKWLGKYYAWKLISFVKPLKIVELRSTSTSQQRILFDFLLIHKSHVHLKTSQNIYLTYFYKPFLNDSLQLDLLQWISLLFSFSSRIDRRECKWKNGNRENRKKKSELVEETANFYFLFFKWRRTTRREETKSFSCRYLWGGQ